MAFSWKAARDIMRKDSSVSTEYQRLEEFVSLVFLRIYNALEEEWADEADSNGRSYTPAIPEEYQWGSWAIKRADGTSLTGDSLVEHLNKLYRHCATMSVVGLEPRQMIVRKVFQGLTQHMRDGYQLRQLIDLVNELNYHDAKQRHLFGQMYEEMLRIMQSSKETGEYYTPRAVTKFIVEQLNPQLGEKFGDFACGTGGFLTAAIDHLQAQGVETKKQVEQLQNAIVGCELKAIPYLLCATNMLVHGIDNPAITQGTAFSKNINDYDEKDKVNVVGMNPPYGGMTTSTELTNFPENVRTSETAVLFLAYICKRMKENGRAGVIIPDGFLFGSDNASIEVKKILLKEMNLHTIIRLPSSVFAPYTSITTNILFFDNKRAADAPNGFKTKEVWVYRMDMPEGYKHFSKTKPILPEHMHVVKDWWENRVEIADLTDDPAKVTYKAKCYSVQEITESGYNLDRCPYPKKEEVVLAPDALISGFNKSFRENCRSVISSVEHIENLISGRESSNDDSLTSLCGDLSKLVSSLPDKLRKSVLQEAIHGTLVSNDIPDGESTAQELLQQILKERQEKENKEKGKKAKKLSLSVVDEELWELPEGWKWCALRDVCSDFIVPQRDKPTVFDGDIPWCRIEDVEGKYLNGSKSNQCVSLDVIHKMNMRICPVGTVISACSASIGNQAIIKKACCTNQTFIGLVNIQSALLSDYLYYFLMASKERLKELGAGTTIMYISKNKYEALAFPLPPLSIQCRIVEKIEEVFSAIDRLHA